MKKLNRNDLIAHLKSLNVFVCGTSEDFNATHGGIWVSLEEGKLRNYADELDSPFDDYLKSEGWFLEMYDTGTALIYPC